MSALHQLTMSYVPEEDRILFRLSTTDKKEYRLHLTRRFIHVLWGALKQTFSKDAELARIVVIVEHSVYQSLVHVKCHAQSAATRRAVGR